MRKPTLRWNDGAVELLDQTLLPHEVKYIRCTDLETLAEAIRSLRVRGAPAIGLAAAVLDKVLHHSITVYIKGENYRLKSRRKVGLSYPPPGGSN